ncbi:MAG: YbhB/YbcL family Raf kinase inhibitor-like protein [Desulfosalsimonas sp.]
MGFALSEMQLKTPAFENRGQVPQKHTGYGDDISPPMEWTNAPEGTRSFAIICHDPDAPLVLPGTYGFVHWVLYNIPGSVTSLPEGTGEYTKGVNDANNTGYNGPKPPAGHGIHHYFWWVLALNQELNLEPGLTMWQLLERVEPYLIGMNRVVGIYEK